jgi:hypothetical protein
MKSRSLFIWICLISLSTLVAYLFYGCQRVVSVPEHLKGVWKTDAPRYKGRYLEFTTNLLVFGVGKDEEISCYIQKIESERKSEGILSVSITMTQKAENGP